MRPWRRATADMHAAGPALRAKYAHGEACLIDDLVDAILSGDGGLDDDLLDDDEIDELLEEQEKVGAAVAEATVDVDRDARADLALDGLAQTQEARLLAAVALAYG